MWSSLCPFWLGLCVLLALVSLFLTPNLGCFLSLFFREVFNSSLSFFFWSPMIWVLVDLRLCQRPLSPSMLFWISFLSSYRCVRTHTHAHTHTHTHTPTYVYLFYWWSSTGFSISQLYFPRPTHTHLPPLTFSPCGFVHGPSICALFWPFPFFLMLFFSSLPSGYGQFVLNFRDSGYISLACLFCYLGSTYRWDHMVFVFHNLACFT